MKKDIVIFGTGKIGRLALAKYKDRILFAVDNNKDVQESFWEDGIEIKNPDILDPKADYTVIIASKNQELMEKQLLELGISRYDFFVKESRAYYDTDELIFNQYGENAEHEVSEQEYNADKKRMYAIETVNYRVEQLYGKDVLFDHVEIETVNRCNGVCEFCPVSRYRDTREYKKMSWELFRRIIDQLAEMDYEGKIALFSNNEPFLDEDIIEKHKYTREKLPKARMHLFTNGTLLTVEKFVEIIQYLDELIIDNYQQQLKLIQPCAEIAEYCERHPELKKKVTIVLRKPKEILTSRGGEAPNRKEIVSYGNARCVLPYKQLIIRPDGKVSLCCNDPLGKNTMGDLSKDTILDVWNNDKFRQVRKCLYDGRKNWKQCEHCDVFSLQ